MSSPETDSISQTTYSSASSIAVFSTSSAKQFNKRPQVRICAKKSSHSRALPTISSNISLPAKSPSAIKTLSLHKIARSNNKTSSFSTSGTSIVSNQHTLKIKFINTNKSYFQLKKELVDKQKPVIPLYKFLLRAKKKLEDLDKLVIFEDSKLMPYTGYNQAFKFEDADKQVPLELLHETGNSVEAIPKTLAEVCQSLLNEKILIVELLNKATKSEVDIGATTGRIEPLKSEDQWLHEPRQAILTEHENKIKNLVPNRESLLNIKQFSNNASALELKLQKKENKDASKFASRLITTDSKNYTETTYKLIKQQECINRYKMMLQDSENKLSDEANTISDLQKEIMQLQIRQRGLEDQNCTCPTDQMQTMIKEGHQKLNELMKRSVESKQVLEHNANVIEQQIRQMSQMENLLKGRETMVAELILSKDKLILHNESLVRNSQEMRTVLTEVTQEGKMKNRLIIELQEKIDLKERQITNLENNIKALEFNLMMANEKRFMLQEAFEYRKKELQSAKTHFKQLADINQRNGRQKFWDLF